MRNVVATGFEFLHLVEGQQRFHELTVVPLFEAPSRPGDLKTQKVHGTTRVSQHHHVRQEKTCFHALDVSHEVLFGSCSDHVIHVAQEDRIISPFLTLRCGVGFQLLLAHGTKFFSAVNVQSCGETLSPCSALLHSQTSE